MGMVITQYEVYLVGLDPAVGHEMMKSRPCVVLSPDEMNRHIGTIVVAPMTTKSHPYPTRVDITFDGKAGWIVLDQIRIIDKQRLIKKLGGVDPDTIGRIKGILKEMLVD